MILPPLIALVGHPKSGKSTASELLGRHWSFTIVDDGYPLRDFVSTHYGATAAQVYTQEGKAQLAYWTSGTPVRDRAGKHLTWREVLGRVGNQIEALHGDDILARMAIEKVDGCDPCVFASVRRTQGRLYRHFGGIVVQIDNPLAGPSGNDFDLWDEQAVDYCLLNDGLARGLCAADAALDLQAKLAAILRNFAHRQELKDV